MEEAEDVEDAEFDLVDLPDSPESRPLVSYQPKPPPAPPPVREGAIEQAIGLKLAGWVGAIVVVFGAVLGVKYAYDAGWFGDLIPPELRLLLMAIGGFGLIGAGEWVYRRVGAVSAVGLYGAGVGTLFLVSYTGYGYFGIYSSGVAFALMGLTAVVGAGVALRGRLVSIAVLSQLGGHLAPLLLGGDTTNLLPLLSYLLMLQTVALALAWRGGSPRWWGWWTLRWLALIATSLWMTLILLDGESGALEFTFALVLLRPVSRRVAPVGRPPAGGR